MEKIGIIGGTGLTSLNDLEIVKREVVHTPFGEPSGAFTTGNLHGQEVIFLARHGYSHHIPPHQINYRANLWAMDYLKVKNIVAITTVGGITSKMKPAQLVIPDQIIDYTYARNHTYFDQDLKHVTHIDFSSPYCAKLRDQLVNAANEAKVDCVNGGVYAATQGPRLETAAEINRLEKDGCDLVGMTGMPEASLARELELCYATLSVVANWAAGRSDKEIKMDDIQSQLQLGMKSVIDLLAVFLKK